MRPFALGKLFTALFLLAAIISTADAQTLPPLTGGDQMGMAPYQSYHGGDIDTVGLSNGTLSLNTPFLSYPQRGSVRLSFNLYYNNAPQHVADFCSGNPPTCHYEWGYLPGDFVVPLERGDPFVGWAQQVGVNTSNIKMTVGEGEGSYTVWYGIWSIQSADGSGHILGNLGTMTRIGGTGHNSVDEYQYSGPFESLDATGWRYGLSLTSTSVPYGEGPSTGLIGPDGINYGGTSEEDPNGNKVTFTSGIFTDTLDRQIPAPPKSTSASNTSTSACPQGLLPVVSAVLWSPPEPSGTSGNYVFCYVNVAVNIPPQNGWLADADTATLLQSIVLPNGQSWNFAFNDPGDGSTYNGSPVNYGTLTQVTLPTGGTIAYTYTTVLSTGGLCQNSGRWVATRTVNANDGTGPHQWTYAYTYGSSTTVTDPLGNYTVHTFGYGNNSCALYETDNQQYQNGGTLLKTVQTIYTGDVGGNWNALVNVVPTQTETIWPNNQTNETTFSYDSGFSYLDYAGVSSHSGTYGKVLTKPEYDYGSGAPGTLLRTTTTTYQALNNSTYLTNNLLDLPASVKVTGGSQTAYTTYGYDETALVSSGITTQHDSAPPDGTARGNQTSIHRQLNNGSATAVGTCPAVSSGGYLVTNVTYFDTGKVDVSKDPCTYSTTYAYSSTYFGAYPTTVTNAKSQSTAHTYDLNTGLLASTTDPNLQPTTFTYDNMWRLATATYPDGGLDTITRQEATFPNTATLTKKITSSENYVTTNVFDGLGRVSESLVTDPQGNIETDTTYDADGRIYTVSNPYRTKTDSTYGITTTVYDALGRTCVVVPPDGTAVANTSCPTTQPSNDVLTSYVGSTTTVTDQQGKSRESKTDGLGRLTTVWEDPAGLDYETVYTYDALNDLASVVQGGSHNRSFVFDSLKRLTSSTNPEAGTVTYTYDADSDVLTKKDARALTITYAYDALNRMTGKTYSNGDPAVTDTYDQSGCLGLSACYNVGRRTGMTDAAGSESWAYDSMGRELAQQRTTNTITKSTASTYDLNGDLATLTYPTGRTITYTTDSAGRPSEAQDLTNSISYIKGPALNGISNVGVCYAPQGAISCANIGPTGGSTWLDLAISYTDRLQPDIIQYYNQAGSLMALLYSFVDSSSHNNGNVMSITNQVDGTRSQRFTYDSLNRILTAQTTSTTGANCWGQNFGYDEWANLTSASVSQCTAPMLSVMAGTNNQLTGFTYDASGNVLADGNSNYTWNAESEIISVSEGMNYTYDGDGDRIEKSNGKIYWYGADSAILDESDLSGNITDEYVFFGGKRIAHRVVSSNSIYYYAEDFLGTSRQIYTSSSTVCYDADFYPFGGERDVTNTCAQNYKFEGKERDAETNNDDFGARYYSSQFGRWTSPDWSAVPEPVPYANLTNPQTLNLYAMVRDNPETFADLDGHVMPNPDLMAGSNSVSDSDIACLQNDALCNSGGPVAQQQGQSQQTGDVQYRCTNADCTTSTQTMVVKAKPDDLSVGLAAIAVPAAIGGAELGPADAILVGGVITVYLYKNKDAARQAMAQISEAARHIHLLNNDPGKDPRNHWRTEIRDRLARAKTWANRMSDGSKKAAINYLIRVAQEAVPEE